MISVKHGECSYRNFVRLGGILLSIEVVVCSLGCSRSKSEARSSGLCVKDMTRNGVYCGQVDISLFKF